MSFNPCSPYTASFSLLGIDALSVACPGVILSFLNIPAESISCDDVDDFVFHIRGHFVHEGRMILFGGALFGMAVRLNCNRFLTRSCVHIREILDTLRWLISVTTATTHVFLCNKKYYRPMFCWWQTCPCFPKVGLPYRSSR